MKLIFLLFTFVLFLMGAASFDSKKFLFPPGFDTDKNLGRIKTSFTALHSPAPAPASEFDFYYILLLKFQ